MSLTKFSPFAIAAAIVVGTSVSVSADDTIYSNQNPAADQHAIYGTGEEYGDEIVMSGGSRFIRSFNLEYFANYSQTQAGQLRFYQNDGALVSVNGVSASSPGTLIYESGKFDINSGYNTVNVDFSQGGSFRLPNNRMTWTVTFDGIDNQNEAGVLLYDKPTVGASGNDFWRKNGSIWSLEQVGLGKVANFNAKITAVPEPSTFALLGLGTLALVAGRRLKK